MNYCAVYDFITAIFNTLPGNNHNMVALFCQCVILTNGFSQQSGNVMTHNTVTDFLTDRKSVTIGTTLPCFHIHYQILISSGSTVFVDPLKCGISPQLLKYLSFHTFTLIIRRKARTRLARKHRPSHSDLVHSSDYADNFFLPFALLLASTFLPFAVLILLRKP